MQQKKSRLISLDGIRGLAMILVFLNHIDPAFISNLLPSSLGIISATLFSSGVLGVSFLFILTGFLMAYIYPQPSEKLMFLQKRYTRIFPLFLTLCVVMLILKNIPRISSFLTIPVIIGLALIVHLIWVGIIKNLKKGQLARKIFKSFLILQVIIGCIYVFVIMKFPPIVFNQQLPGLIREGMIGLINSTLTLPLGNYVPMLDGVYWSLTSEVLFYILYPVICVPFIIYLVSKKRSIKLIFLATLFPLFAGADILSHKILVISMLQLSLFSYFVVGMSLGYLYKRKPEIFEKLNVFTKGPLKYWSLVFFILTLIAPHFLQTIISSNFHLWINLLWALPFGLVVALAINKKTALAKFLSSKFLIFIGLISYSIYLTHASILHMTETIFHAKNFLTNTSLILVSFAITVVISMLTYWLLEKPYFKKSNQAEKPINSPISISRKKISILIGTISIIYLFAIFGAFQSDFNFFSMQVPQSSNIIISPKVSPSTIFVSMHDYPQITMQFKAEENDLGVITMHITHKTAPNGLRDLNSQLLFRIKEKGSLVWYSQSGYDLYRIKDSLTHPFGFPLIADSKGKTYVFELYLSNPSSAEYILLDTNKNSIKAVYQANKMQLIKNPVKLVSFTANKVINVVDNKDAKETFLLFLPFFLVSMLLIFSKNKLNG